MLCFSNSLSSACTKCYVFPGPFPFPSSLRGFAVFFYVLDQHPGKGTEKTQHFQSASGKGIGKTQQLQSCLRELEKHSSCNHAYEERKWKKAGTEPAKRV